MTRVATRLQTWLALLLEPVEREVVLGDLEEAGQGTARRLLDLSGLVVRRELQGWTTLRPWMVLVGIVIPFGVSLSLVSAMASGLTTVYSWMYFANWTPLNFSAPFLADFMRHVGDFCAAYTFLICAAWSAGFTLASLLGRGVVVNVLLLLLLLAFDRQLMIIGFGAIAKIKGLNLPDRLNDPNAAAFSLAVYGAVLPVVLFALCICVPVLIGVRAAISSRQWPMIWQRITFACTLTSLVAVAASVFWLRHGWQTALSVLPSLVH